jgi:hypothetical protein
MFGVPHRDCGYNAPGAQTLPDYIRIVTAVA